MNHYQTMLANTDKPFCWACGRDETDRPRHWRGDWQLHRAHFAAGSGRMTRINERWYVNLLCPQCHYLHRHHFTEIKLGGDVFPALTNANMLWLKIERDSKWWNRELVAKAWIGIPPSPETPHEYFMHEYESRRGVPTW